MRQLASLIVICVLTISINACKKKKNDPEPPVAVDNGACSANVSGAGYTATTSKAVFTKHVIGSNTSYAFYVEGRNTSANKLMFFTIRSGTEHTLGTYTITQASGSEAYYYENYDLSNMQAWAAPNFSTLSLNQPYGTVEITELTGNHTKGNFSFTAYTLNGATGSDTIRTVTNGTFDVPMIRQGF